MWTPRKRKLINSLKVKYKCVRAHTRILSLQVSQIKTVSGTQNWLHNKLISELSKTKELTLQTSLFLSLSFFFLFFWCFFFCMQVNFCIFLSFPSSSHCLGVERFPTASPFGAFIYSFKGKQWKCMKWGGSGRKSCPYLPYYFMPKYWFIFLSCNLTIKCSECTR